MPTEYHALHRGPRGRGVPIELGGSLCTLIVQKIRAPVSYRLPGRAARFSSHPAGRTAHADFGFDPMRRLVAIPDLVGGSVALYPLPE